MSNKLKFLFALIILFIPFLHTYKLDTNPEGFDQTEAAFGYNAFSILKTGKDEYGKFLPMVLPSVGDYKLAGFSYWEIPFIAAFGLSELSLRFSVAVAGLVSLILIYFITLKLFKNQKIALLTLFFTGISPWHLILSRMAYDPMIAFMFYLASLLLFIYWYENKRILFLILSAASLSLSVLTYYSVWLLAPFTVLSYLIYIRKKHLGSKKSLYLSLISLLPLLTISILILMTRGQRLYQDSTVQVNAKPLLAEQIREDQNSFPLFITRFFHNKFTFYPIFILQNLSKNLSMDYLFLAGDKIDRRFYVPFNGVLYLWTAPFFILGLLFFWKNYSIRINLLIIATILLVFSGSAFSEMGSETERTFFVSPVFSFLISYGLVTVLSLIQKKYLYKALLFFSGIILLYNLAFFNHEYYWHGNIHEPWARNFGTHEMVNYVSSSEKNYKKMVVPDNTYIYFYFYNKIDPKIAWEESTNTNKQANFIGFHLRAKIGHLLTMPIECPAAGKLDVLYVCEGTKIPHNSKIIKIIRYRDNQPAFTFIEFNNSNLLSVPPENLKFMDKYGILDNNDNLYWKSESEIK